ncbi:MAG: hypothetical protein U0575_03700 [Phycisphaerales bacterium]
MARHLGIVPEPLGAKTVDALLARYAVIGLETWDVVERELTAYAERFDRDAAPRIDELFERYPHQHWMNRPGLKGDDARALHRRAVDAIAACDDAFFADLAAQLADAPETTKLAVERAMLARRRERSDRPWGLMHLHPVPVAELAARHAHAALDPAAFDAALLRWERERGALGGRSRAIASAALESFAARLAERGIEPERDDATREQWLPDAWNIWVECSVSLRASILACVARDRAAIDELAALLPPDTASRLRDEAMIDGGSMIAPWDAQLAGDELDRAARLRGVEPSVRAAIAALAETWRDRDRQLRNQLAELFERESPCEWPLAGGGWTPTMDGSAFEARRKRLEESRRDASAETIQRLSALLGERATVVIAPTPETNGQLDPVESPSAEARQRTRRDEPWIAHRTPRLAEPCDSAQRLWLDSGPVDAASLQAIGRWAGVDVSAGSPWLAIVAAFDSDVAAHRAARDAALGAPAARNTWRFDNERGYTHDTALSDQIVAASRDEVGWLAEREGRMFDDLAALAPTPSSHRRATLVAWAREIDRACALLHVAAPESLDRRADANAFGIAVAMLVGGARGGVAIGERAVAAADSHDSHDPDGPHDSAESIETLLADRGRSLVDIVRRRADRALSPATELVRLSDRRMWTRGEAATALASRRAEIVAQWWRDDTADRVAFMEGQAALIDAVDAARPDLAGDLRRHWRAAAFPNVLGTEPAIAARLRSAVDASEHGSAETEARFVAADDAVVARLIEVAVGAGTMTDWTDRTDRTDRTPQELVALNLRLTALGDARRELADRATIRLRIAREEAQRRGVRQSTGTRITAPTPQPPRSPDPFPRRTSRSSARRRARASANRCRCRGRRSSSSTARAVRCWDSRRTSPRRRSEASGPSARRPGSRPSVDRARTR